MGQTLAEKLIENHLVEGRPVKGDEIGLKIDQTLTQDATGTMVYLAFEAMGRPRIETELSISYVDHNLLQTDFKNADDHLFLQTAARKFGVYFSRPGNGICHQVHLERFGRPGKTLIGSDSHTPTNGGLGALAIGAGGLDVAAAMAGYPFYLTYPKILGVRLTGSLPEWVSGRDIALELLRRLTVKGGLGYIIEFYGPGVMSLDVPNRATVANLGTELGATTTIWPSDENTRLFLRSQGREEDYAPLSADEDAVYDQVMDLDLASLEPMIACPSSPDNVIPVREAAGREVAQVIIGSCANSSYRDLMTIAGVVDGKTIHERISCEINPGSRQVLENIISNGGLMKLVQAGARIQQPGCFGCIGIGQAPASGTVSLRTFTRNFPGRSGTENDQVYLCSPETAAAAALTGRIIDPRDLGDYPKVVLPDRFVINDRAIIPPLEETSGVEIIRGPNIKPFPEFDAMPDRLESRVVLKTGDNITTDHIMPAGSKILPLRSNIPAISRFAFQTLSADFAERAQAEGPVAVVAGENYGQGSSREHAAIAPRYLGVKVKLAKSFARIHKANLINFGILPLTFVRPDDYDGIAEGDAMAIEDVRERILGGAVEIPVQVGGKAIMTSLDAS
ncbi:MAG: aconitate hydratase, partial [Deltaproteobacteria bacterium]|nr:aconitate hydratase [Deltaproteobacteria bacterium]